MIKKIAFSNSFLFTLIISAILIIIGFSSYAYRGGFNFSLDFSPGLLVHFETSKHLKVQDVEKFLRQTYKGVSVQSVKSKTGSEFTVRIKAKSNPETAAKTTSHKINKKTTKTVPTIGKADATIIQKKTNFSDTVIKRLKKEYPNTTILESNYVSPSFSSSLVTQTIIIVVIALFLIFVYIWIRFELFFAIAAILSLVHDALFLLGVILLFHMSFSLLTVSALMTILGYSLNDTVVIFDRIRQYLRVHGRTDIRNVIDEAITATLSRTTITALLTFLSILFVCIFTTGEIQEFSLLFIIGIIIGTYSSIGIASACYYFLDKIFPHRRIKQQQKKANKVFRIN